MTATSITAALDLDALEEPQRHAWASGDVAVLSAGMSLVAEQLCDSADLHAGWRVLDVATGSGNAAIAAARLGCTAVGVGCVPELLERGRRRAAAEGLAVDLREGDAEALPFPDASFDAVTSVFGLMFAPDQRQAATELLRVCRSGATIALASWSPDGFVGELSRAVAAHAPLPPDTPSPTFWASEEGLRWLFGDSIASLELMERTFTFRFPSPEHVVALLRLWHGPTMTAFAALAGAAREALESDLVALARRYDRLATDATAIPATYLEAIALTR